MGMRPEECVVTEEALDAVSELYADTTGRREMEQAAEHMSGNARYQIEVDCVEWVGCPPERGRGGVGESTAGQT